MSEIFGILGCVGAVIVYFLYFKGPVEGAWSGVGMAALFAGGGYLVFTVFGVLLFKSGSLLSHLIGRHKAAFVVLTLSLLALLIGAFMYYRE